MHTTLFYCIKDIFTKTGAGWDQLAPSEEDAIEYAHNYINDEPERFIPGTKKGTSFYTLAKGGEIINRRLREDREDPDVPRVTEDIFKIRCKKDLVLYRGITEDTFQQMKDAAHDYKNVDLYDKGFLQTSLVKGKEVNRHIKLRIFVPAGTNVIYLGNVNDEEETYYEVAVQRGAKLRIISKDKVYINCLLLGTL